MTDQPIKEDPVKRFRKLLGSLSPLTRLPRRTIGSVESLPKQAGGAPHPAVRLQIKKDVPPPKEKKSQPGAIPVKESIPASTLNPKFDSASKGGASVWAPRFWTTASVISLTINLLMAVILIVLVVSVYRLGLDVNYIMDVGKSLVGLPGGLYENFEKMERANIETSVKVETSIPVKFDLTLNQQTNVVLSQDVTITNALVTVNTGGLNISRANTTIVLPVGTTLPVLLNLTVPVDTQVPVVLEVPVNIPLSQTELNEPFVGLQEVIEPLYCFLQPEAFNMDGEPICR
ncbi:MAG: hypothetical protein DPW18_19580 [Chloroflexi bacterium]|nr:hypothetical protein [Chloroflexota bacterium]MDL1944976.1 hypothetical protein [Chloroflexi bacterium CFX2]